MNVLRRWYAELVSTLLKIHSLEMLPDLQMQSLEMLPDLQMPSLEMLPVLHTEFWNVIWLFPTSGSLYRNLHELSFNINFHETSKVNAIKRALSINGYIRLTNGVRFFLSRDLWARYDPLLDTLLLTSLVLGYIRLVYYTDIRNDY